MFRGWTLALAHARSGDPVAMAEHLGAVPEVVTTAGPSIIPNG